jgi:probable rRNA maturation factor
MDCMANQRVLSGDIEKHAARALQKWLKKAFTEPQLRKKIWARDAKKEATPFHADLLLCTSAKMIKLNQTFRGQAYATDILSFPVADFFQLQGLLGDLVICVPTLLKQAKEFDHSWKDELDVLLVHGVLHLLGFDHEVDEKHAREMEKWERKFLGGKAKKNLITRAEV